MKRHILKLMFAVALSVLAFAPQTANAQLGNLINKVKKVIVETPATPVNNQPASSGANDWKQWFDLALTSCEGDRATGEVLFTFAAQGKGSNEELGISGDSKDFAADSVGKQYFIAPLNKHSKGNKPLVSGAPRLYYLLAKQVPAGTGKFSVVRFAYGYSYPDFNRHTGMNGVFPIEFARVPIHWNTLPPNNIVGIPFVLKTFCNVEILSCEGNKQTGDAVITFSVTTKSNNVSFSLSDNRTFDCFDANGNVYKATYNGSINDVEREIGNLSPSQWSFTIKGLPQTMSVIPAAKLGFGAHDSTNDLLCNTGMSNVSPIVLKNIVVNWK